MPDPTTMTPDELDAWLRGGGGQPPSSGNNGSYNPAWGDYQDPSKWAPWEGGSWQPQTPQPPPSTPPPTHPQPPGNTGNKPNVISSGGYDWIEELWSDGSHKGWSMLGKTKTNAIDTTSPDYNTWWQRQQDELARRRQAFDEEQSRLANERANRIDPSEQARLQQQAAIQQAQLDWAKEQFAQEQAQREKEYAAKLATSPKSWLEYAAYTGSVPKVQPWMLPLQQTDYGWKGGENLPNWQPTSAKGTATGETGIPELLRPSAQYWARLAPSMQQQYMGYEQARTGATPEDVAWRQYAFAPPGGNAGLTYVR